MSLRGRTEMRPTSMGPTVAAFLLVTCEATHLAVPAELVRGIVKPNDGGMADILRALGVQAEVSDLSERFGFERYAPSAEMRVVVCGMKEMRWAFRVGAVIGLEDVESSRITLLSPQFTGPERQWFAGMFLFRDTVALVIQPRWLLSDDRHEPSRSPQAESIESDHEAAATVITVAPAVAIQSWRGTASCVDGIELEEATDADDLPWAEL